MKTQRFHTSKFSFRLPKEMLEKLIDASEQKRIHVAEFVRQALRESLVIHLSGNLLEEKGA